MRFAVVMLLVACGTQRRGEPIAGPLPLDGQAVRGQQVFMAQCNGCHPGGEAGVGPAITNAPPPVWVQRVQVRLGAGAMPAFGRTEVSGTDLDAVAAYLHTLKHHRPPDSE
jgi:mono/diheme cytochrome c family protein